MGLGSGGILLYAGDPDVASDAVAEAFAQAIGRGSQDPRSIAWVTKAAYRIAAGDMKKRRIEGYPVIDRGYACPSRMELVASRKLSPKQRDRRMSYFRDGYTLAEVADLIGSTTAAVGVHLHRARRRLRDLLDDDDD